MKGAFFLNTFAACIAIAAQSLNAAAEPAFQTPAEPPDVKLKEPARLENPDSFSMILFGDPQTYMKFTFSQPIFELMTAWVAAHKEVLNIKAALCTGDLVERNDLLTKFDHGKKYVNGNTPSMDMSRAPLAGSTASCPTFSRRATTTTATFRRKTATQNSPSISRF